MHSNLLQRRFRYESSLYPKFSSVIKEGGSNSENGGFRLDVIVSASGFAKKDQEELEKVLGHAASLP